MTENANAAANRGATGGRGLAKWLVVGGLIVFTGGAVAMLGTADVVRAALPAEQYLADNKGRKGVITTASGLQYEVIKAADGPKPTAADGVLVHYEGKLVDGTVFDSSIARGQPAAFGVAQVIPGWVEGLQLMSKGSKYRFTIPPELGYGERGAGGVIPPGAVLVFDVELIDIAAQPAG